MIDDLPLEKVYHLLYNQKEALLGDTMPFGKYQGKPLKEVPASYLAWLKGQGTFEKPEHASLKASLVKLDLL
jgi:DNA polymerase-3 subunit epsilon